MAEEKKDTESKETSSAPKKAEKKNGGSSIWKWILISCLVIFVIALLAAGGCSYFLYKAGKEVVGEMQEEVERQNELLPEEIMKGIESGEIQVEVDLPEIPGIENSNSEEEAGEPELN